MKIQVSVVLLLYSRERLYTHAQSDFDYNNNNFEQISNVIALQILAAIKLT
jgi:hypothetical protein